MEQKLKISPKGNSIHHDEMQSGDKIKTADFPYKFGNNVTDAKGQRWHIEKNVFNRGPHLSNVYVV